MIGDYELITKGAYFYDPCTRVPMILRLPAAERAGTRVGDLVQPHDLAATLLHAAGMPAPEVATLMPESQDLAALARGEVTAPRDHALTMYRNSGYGNRGYWDPPIYGTMFPRRPLQAVPVPRPRRAPRPGGRTVRHAGRPSRNHQPVARPAARRPPRPPDRQPARHPGSHRNGARRRPRRHQLAPGQELTPSPEGRARRTAPYRWPPRLAMAMRLPARNPLLCPYDALPALGFPPAEASHTLRSVVCGGES